MSASRLLADLFAAALDLSAQTGAGRVQGLVRDPSGAAIPAVAVTLEQVATAAKTYSKANESGLFRFPGLTPGEYRVTVTASGLEK
jgi:hypothetical protein